MTVLPDAGIMFDLSHPAEDAAGGNWRTIIWGIVIIFARAIQKKLLISLGENAMQANYILKRILIIIKVRKCELNFSITSILGS